jgi:putative membrane protein
VEAFMLVRRRRGFAGLLLTWVLSAVAVFVAARVVPGVEVDSFGAALAAAAVLGVVNTVVRPLLVLMTLPVTILTLGLFLLIVNAACVGLAATLLSGFHVAGLGPAVLMVIVVTVVSGALSWLFGGDDVDRRRGGS